MKKYALSITIAAAFFAHQANAQEDKDKKNKGVGTEVVNVTSEYQATLNDAFKINDNPLIEDEDINQKKEVKYTIFSVPVASTFSPAKGEAAKVDNDSLAKFYSNYALFGFGNYNTIRGELGIVETIGSKNMYVGGLLKHISSGGGIENVQLDDSFSKSNLDFTLGQRNENNQWNTQFGAMTSKYNWYGTPADFFVSNFNFDLVDPLQKYNDVHIGASYESYIGAFEKIDARYKYFWDDYSSKESRFVIAPKFSVELPNNTVYINLEADYVNTQFANNGIDNVVDTYNHLNLSANPSIKFFDADYSLELGAGLTYILGKEQGIENNSLVIYPMVKANFNLVPNIVQAYLGAVGGVQQNSYADLADQNPFLAPTFVLRPTRTNYDVYAGMKGKLYHNLSYNVRANYKNEDDKAMFTINPYNINLQNKQGYQYGNSFGLIYDKVTTFTLFGELNFDFSGKAQIGLSGEYNSFNIDQYQDVFHIPQGKINVNVLYNFTDQWFADANLGYVGQRYEFSGAPISTMTDDIKLGDFYDLNVTVGYRPTAQWTIFAKGLNLANENYLRFNQYQVQGLQVLGGAIYKFDFK
ncbi:TonB-dependent receptor [Flavobacterium sp. CBA20B-1]|uniref:TonB-dependent receptor n=1 Tax=unclassified Flavobacterium TaxID=196869 RepID=UPI0022252C48|nr:MULTISPECIES: TonB-dependent receptor [unclassified Flavobacterium]WCM42198.1 TonB-dependent receptor [Flavobacterium sp. CBA20B-1]